MMQFVVRSWKVWPAGRPGAMAGVPATPPMPGTTDGGEAGFAMVGAGGIGRTVPRGVCGYR